MPESNTRGNEKAAWHLWFTGVASLLWGSIGAMDYLMTQTKNEAYMGNYSPEQLQFFYEIPSWVVAAWAIGVWGGVLGAIFLLLRKGMAVWILLASLLAVLVTNFHNYVLSNGMEVSGDTFSLVLTATIFLIALGLYLYSRSMQRRGLLT